MLFDLVREAADQSPERPVVVAAEGVVTYEECFGRCEDIAKGLTRSGVRRFGCALRSPADILSVAGGSSAAAVEACLYPPDLDAEQIDLFAARFGHDIVIHDNALQASNGPRVVTLDGLAPPSDEPLPASGPDAPLLILTTGTTGEPKGARYDWSRLVKAAGERQPDRGARWLLTYNLNQFAGLQILVHAVASQATLVVPRSRGADDVIEAIASHSVTHVSGTPTFWRLLAGRLDEGSAAELPLRQITLGGEAAPEGLIERLSLLFPDARVSHVFAGTEFGSVVSVSDGRSGLPLSVLNRDADANAQVRIHDGELQIRSRFGMLGYHQSDEVGGEWHATGDLVEVAGDRIQFVGRATEIINVGGAKVHPLPIEELVCSVEGVQLAAVYGHANPITGQIVAVDVVVAKSADPAEVPTMIREACASLPAPSRPRRVRIVPELAVRGSKLVRQSPSVTE